MAAVGDDYGIQNKSRRTANDNKGLSEDDLKAEDLVFKPPPPEYYGVVGELMFTLAEVIAIILFATCTKYGEGSHPSSKMSEADARDHV